MKWTFALPDLGEGLAEAEILRWHLEVGENVQEDQDLVDVETDKAIITVPSPVAGTLSDRCANEGDTLAVGAALAVFETSESSIPGSARAPGSAVSEDSAVSEPEVAVAVASDDRAAAAPVEATESSSGMRRPAAAPSVRRAARELGIDLWSVRGTGPGGRILKEDLLSPLHPVGRSSASTSSSCTEGSEVEIPLRGLRKAVARTMSEAWQTIPHIFDFREADATALMSTRALLREQARIDGDEELAAALTPVVLLAKLTAIALARHPEIHGYVDDERQMIVRHDHCHLGVATATSDGLLTPVLRDVDRRSIPDLARELHLLVPAARARTLTVEQLSGASFLINNLGALGTRWGTPLIPTGLGGNVGFGRIEQRPVVQDGQVVACPTLPLSISADHRLVDGDVLAAFAATVVRLVETPVLALGAS